jgi:hypothetical protein
MSTISFFKFELCTFFKIFYSFLCCYNDKEINDICGEERVLLLVLKTQERMNALGRCNHEGLHAPCLNKSDSCMIIEMLCIELYSDEPYIQAI